MKIPIVETRTCQNGFGGIDLFLFRTTRTDEFDKKGATGNQNCAPVCGGVCAGQLIRETGLAVATNDFFPPFDTGFEPVPGERGRGTPLGAAVDPVETPDDLRVHPFGPLFRTHAFSRLQVLDPSIQSF
jgi:hypothetical protein